MTERPNGKKNSPRQSPPETSGRVTEKSVDRGEPHVRDAEKNLETNRIAPRSEEQRYETEVSGVAPI